MINKPHVWYGQTGLSFATYHGTLLLTNQNVYSESFPYFFKRYVLKRTIGFFSPFSLGLKRGVFQQNLA